MKDIQVQPDEYEKNLEEMILKVKDNVKGIFILSPYIIEPNAQDMMRARMDEYVEICKKLSDKHGCVFVDFQRMYEDYCKIRHSSFIAWDRIHPNQVGATLMAREFLKHCDFEY
jgi:lysophospholipase L1-like esterase